MSQNVPKSVLVIDDDEEFLHVMKKSLVKYNVKLDTACDGKNALHKANIGNYDLFITDCMMPRMGADGFVKELRSIARYQDTPLVVISASFESDIINNLKKFNVAEFLAKPVDIERLTDAMDKFLEIKSSDLLYS